MDGSDAAMVERPAAGLGLGARLRAARTARALSVTQVAETLRLDERSVTALEEERFGMLGAPVFVRGHLRRYAELLGLSAETVLAAYRAIAPDSDALPDLSRPGESPEPRRIGPWVWRLAAGVLLLMVLLAWMGSRSYQSLSPAALVPALDSLMHAQPGVVLEPQPVASTPAIQPAPAETTAMPAGSAVAESPGAAEGD